MDRVHESYEATLEADGQVGERARREILTDLETIGLVETWIDTRGREGRVKQIETVFDPAWIHDAMDPYFEQSDHAPLRRPD